MRNGITSCVSLAAGLVMAAGCVVAAPIDGAQGGVAATVAPADGEAQEVYEYVVAGGDAKEEERLVIGVTLEDVKGALAHQLGVKNGKAILVKSVEEGSPAAKAGIRMHDVIHCVNDSGSCSLDELHKAIGSMKDGGAIQLRVLRRGEEKKIHVKPVKANALRILRADGAQGEAESVYRALIKNDAAEGDERDVVLKLLAEESEKRHLVAGDDKNVEIVVKGKGGDVWRQYVVAGQLLSAAKKAGEAEKVYSGEKDKAIRVEVLRDAHEQALKQIYSLKKLDLDDEKFNTIKLHTSKAVEDAIKVIEGSGLKWKEAELPYVRVLGDAKARALFVPKGELSHFVEIYAEKDGKGKGKGESKGESKSESGIFFSDGKGGKGFNFKSGDWSFDGGKISFKDGAVKVEGNSFALHDGKKWVIDGDHKFGVGSFTPNAGFTWVESSKAGGKGGDCSCAEMSERLERIEKMLREIMEDVDDIEDEIND